MNQLNFCSFSKFKIVFTFASLMGLTACPSDVTDDQGGSEEGGSSEGGGPAQGGQGGEDGQIIGRGGLSIGNHVGSEGATSTIIASYLLAQPGECLPQQISGCTLANCTPVEPQFMDAGIVEITGGNTRLTLVNQNNVYLASTDDPIFDPGQNLHIAVSGGDVPAHNLDLVGPAVFDVTTPDLAALVVDRTQGLHVEWTPVSGTAVLGVYSDGVSLTCQVDAMSGSYDLPANLLEQLPVGELASFYASNWNIATTTVDGWELQATSYSDATSASGANGAATSPITLQ